MKNKVAFGLQALVLLAVVGFSSCKQKDDPKPEPVATTGNLKFQFSNVVDGKALVLDTIWYVNEAKDSFQVTTYRYFISNIVLTDNKGNKFVEPESYHLIDQATAESRKFTLANVPVGEYTKVTFMIGVDSARNTTGAQTGALDPITGMIWDWKTGYIMAKMEGNAKTSPLLGQGFQLHISGFAGIYKAIQTHTYEFPNNAIVNGTNTPNVHIFSEVLEWFKNPQTISFANYYEVTDVTAKSKVIADNYADMFTVDHIDN